MRQEIQKKCAEVSVGHKMFAPMSNLSTVLNYLFLCLRALIQCKMLTYTDKGGWRSENFRQLLRRAYVCRECILIDPKSHSNSGILIRVQHKINTKFDYGKGFGKCRQTLTNGSRGLNIYYKSSFPLLSTLVLSTIFSRPGQSQGLHHKHLRN